MNTRAYALLAATAVLPLALPAAAHAQTSGEAYCREYQRTITIDGRPERAFGTACREPDGNWRVVTEDSGMVPVDDQALYVEQADLVGVLPVAAAPQYTYVQEQYVPAPIFTSFSFGYSNYDGGGRNWRGGHGGHHGGGWNHGGGHGGHGHR